jgi:UDP-glucuronate 4-epimerase
MTLKKIIIFFPSFERGGVEVILLDLIKYFQKKNNFKLIHLAAQPGVIYSFKNPKSYYENNVLATKNLINSIINKNVSNFIFVSSSSVYGNQTKYPIKETASLKSLNYYANTKIICEKFIKRQLKKHQSVKIVRPFTVYGPFGRPDMLILKFLNFFREKKTINIYNFGNHIRDFTYVEDVAKVIYKLSKLKNKNIQTFNICASNPIKINKVIEYFEKFLKKKVNISRKPRRKGEMEITFGSNNKLKKYLKIKKFTPIELGLKKTINWYKSFPEKNLFNLYR